MRSFHQTDEFNKLDELSPILSSCDLASFEETSVKAKGAPAVANEERTSRLTTSAFGVRQLNSCSRVPTPLREIAHFGTILQVDGNDDIDSETDSDDEKQEGQPQAATQVREKLRAESD